MIELVIKKLQENAKIDDWKLIHLHKESKEAFFIQHVLDMSRGKKVDHYQLTVYRDFVEEDVKYRGSSEVNLYKGMTEKELDEAIAQTYYAAGFVKNRYFPLVAAKEYQKAPTLGNLKNHSMDETLRNIADAVLTADHFQNGHVNSFEVFLNKEDKRIITSTGVDYAATSYYGQLDLVTTCQGKKEEVELHDFFNFATFNRAHFIEKVEALLIVTQDRANAQPLPALDTINVILQDDSVRHVLEFFSDQTSVDSVYQQMSRYSLNEDFQENGQGDRITLSKNPFLPSTAHAFGFDQDGIILANHLIIDHGKVIQLHGSNRISYYLNTEPTGIIDSNHFESGSKSLKDMQSEPYLKVVSFSDLQVDSMVGTIGGEIRLAYYFDGKETIPVTGGSVTANIMDSVKEFYLSQERVQLDRYDGPKYLFMKMKVAGNI